MTKHLPEIRQATGNKSNILSVSRFITQKFSIIHLSFDEEQGKLKIAEKEFNEAQAKLKSLLK